MNIKSRTILIVITGMVIFFNACSPRITTQIVQPFTPLHSRAEVLVLLPNDKIQEDVTRVGAVKVWDSGFTTDCNYDKVMSLAKQEARKHGGNILQITTHKTPDILSTCHRIEASILRTTQTLDGEGVNPDVLALEEEAPQPQHFPKFVLSVHSGWGRQNAKIGDNISPEFKPYAKRLKNGLQSSGSASWFFNGNYGVGAKFHYFGTQNEMQGIYVTNPLGFTEYGLMRDDITVIFLGPSFVSRGIYNKHILNASLSIGYLGYENNFVVVRPYVMKGSDVGFCWDIGYDYSITRNFSLGISVSMLSGLLSKYTLDNGTSKQTITLEKDEMIGLGRYDLSAGFRFNF
jgi:hypothetical protein